MSRLTRRNNDGSVGINDFRYYNYDDFQKMAEKLAHYEDMEEQGGLIELPCAVGDTVWIAFEPDDEMDGMVIGETITQFLYDEDGLSVNIDQPHWGDKVGKDVFLTKEEAERKLQEKQNDNKHGTL